MKLGRREPLKTTPACGKRLKSDLNQAHTLVNLRSAFCVLH
jgi:hypothetical protein